MTEFLPVISLLFAVALFVGCNKASPAANSDRSAPQTAAVESAPKLENSSPNVAGAPASGPAAATTVTPAPIQPVVVPADANMEAVLGQLTQALRKYSFEHRHVPASFSEVVAAGYVNGMPQPPAGKQFAIDKKRVEVVLANR